jgi:hypothetical protein
MSEFGVDGTEGKKECRGLQAAHSDKYGGQSILENPGQSEHVGCVMNPTSQRVYAFAIKGHSNSQIQEQEGGEESG